MGPHWTIYSHMHVNSDRRYIGLTRLARYHARRKVTYSKAILLLSVD